MKKPLPDDQNPLNFLLIEDNDADIRLTREALQTRLSHNKLHVVTNGEDALEFLYKKGEYEDAPTPDVILLDLNLPGMSGLTVLKKIKGDYNLKIIPVIITSTSSNDEDVLECYRNCANGYIVKPIDLDKFFRVIHALEDLWLNIMSLPGRV